MITSRAKGFTIVELLIVIVVIGILAAIVIVAYNGVLSKARDSSRRTDLTNYAKSILSYQTTSSTKLEESSCGTGLTGASGGSGWIGDTYGSNGTVAQCLVAAKSLSTILKDPSGNLSCTGNNNPAGCRAYGIATCNVSGSIRILLYAQLDSPASGESMNDVCSTGWGSLGFNYTKVVQ